MATKEPVKEPSAPKPEVTLVSEGLWRVKVGTHTKPLLRIGLEKKHSNANALFLEVNGSKKFEIGNDCDTCHFWFKCLGDPKVAGQKKIANLPKTISLPRPLGPETIQELSPIFDLLERGEYYVFSTNLSLVGPYRSDDETSYFFNNEFLELWDIEDPAQEGILSDWEHYETSKPRLYRHSNFIEKQYDFVIPMVPRHQMKDEYIKLYQEMIRGGDRPRILMLGLLHRPVPDAVARGHIKNLHSFFASFVLDGHHKLAAYRRAGIPVPALMIVAQKASKYVLLREEGSSVKQKLEERLGAMASP